MRNRILHILLLLIIMFLGWEAFGQPTIVSVTKTDETCDYLDNGTITIQISGGVSPYIYRLVSFEGVKSSPPTPSLTYTFTNLKADFYTIIVYDINGSDTKSATITQPPTIAASVDGSSLLALNCFNDSNGSINITVSGGTPGYTYSWTGPSGYSSTSEDINSLKAGAYSLTITDSKLCAGNFANIATITEPPLFGCTYTKTDISCNGLTDGEIHATGSGGTPGYTFTLNPGSMSNGTGDFTALGVNNYTLSAVDSKGCSATPANITVSQPAALTVSIDGSSVLALNCNNDANGIINITPAGGTPGYTFSWTGPSGYTSTSEDISGLRAGSYSLTISDSRLCNKNYPNIATITQPGPILVSVDGSSVLTLNCFNDATGSINITVSGGTPGYSFNWTGPSGYTSASEDISGLRAGSYSLTITDSKACIQNSTNLATITQPAQITASVDASSVLSLNCYNDTNGSINITASGGTPSYSFNWSGPSGYISTSEDISSLRAGSYSLTITDSKACIRSLPNIATITQPSILSGSISSQTNVLCFGLSTGSVTVAGSGGTPSYSYNIDGGAFGGSGTFTGLAAAAYTVQVKDANNCTTNVAVNITQPASAVSGSISSQANVSCNGLSDGSVTVTGAGGVGPYTYNIDGGTFGVSGTFNGLTAGNHTVQVKDANNCTANVAVNITQPSALSGSINSQTNVLCFGASTGSVTVTGVGGSGTYNYNIDGGTFGASGTFNGLAAGPHTVQVKDANNCTANVAINITQPASAVSGSITSQTNIICIGSSTGSVTVSGSGGTAPYTYNIDGGIFGASGTFNGLAAGAHTVQVKDANNCTANVPVTITQPASGVSGSITGQTNILCFGASTGSVTVAGAGSTGPYSYNIDGGVFGSSGTFNALAAGVHTVQVMDVNSCTANVPVTITQPASAVSGSITNQTNVLCFGASTGSVTVAGAGGTGAYTYNIDGGAFTGSGTFNALAAGTHTVQVKDANNCTSNVAVIITQPAVLSGSISSQINISCNGLSDGTVTIAGAGGTAPYNFNIDGGAFGATSTFSSLATGTHTVQVKDANNCTANVTITITQPAVLTGSITSQTNISCNGLSDGTVTVSGVGGTVPYTYNIDGGVFGASGSFSTLTLGAHTVQLKDANNCAASIAVTITQPTVLIGSILSQTNILCSGSGTGSVTVAGVGGVVPYTYNIDGGVFGVSGTFNALSAGAHNAQVKDANNCTVNVAINITQPASALSGSITSQTNVLCFGASTGSVTVNGSGGASPYIYNIDGGIFGPSGTFNSLAAGVHSVQVNDANSCVANVTVTITQPSAVVSGSITSQTNILCFGFNTGSVSVTGAGGTGPYTYNIDGGVFGASGTFNTLVAGTHTVQVKDANNCTSNVSVLITQPAAISATITSTPYVDASIQGTITISGATGGTGSLTYSISGFGGPFSSATFFNNLSVGTYSVVIKDANGCTYQQNVIISLAPPLAVTVTLKQATCNGSNDAGITLNATNGTGMVQYSIDDSASWNTNGNFNSLGPGTYLVFVKDAIKRYFRDTVILTEPIALNIISIVTPASCSSLSSDGAIDISVIGGTGIKTYKWSTGAVSQDLTGLTAGDYTVNVSDQNNCSASKTITVSSITTVTANAGPDTLLCFGEGLTLNGKGGVVYSWTPATGLSNPNIANPILSSVTRNISFVLTVIGLNSCMDTDTISLSVRSQLDLNAGNDTSVLINNSVNLNATGSSFVNYSWSPVTGLSNPNNAATSSTPDKTTTYVLTAFDSFGCNKSDTLTITVVERLKIYNVFSPNNDGQNDFWDIDYTEFFPNILVEVYTRWGQKIFSSKGYSSDKRWDGTFKGKDVPIGTYYYVIIPYTGATPQKGPVTIVR